MKIEFLNFEGMDYVVRYPHEYTPGTKYPVILFLHGAGTRISSKSAVMENPFFVFTQNDNFPFVTVAPHCIGEQTWCDYFETLKKFVQFVFDAPYTDPERLYCMGASMGGYGTWQLAMSMPEYFAAIAPVCGGGMSWNAYRLVNVPVWAFHGEKDTTVFPEESKRLVNAVNAVGGKARLTLYPESAHDAWTPTYSNSEVFTWLLEHKNENAKKISNKYDNSKIYG